MKIVDQYGPQKWTFIAEHVPGRIGKQCRERWHNHLNPKINKEQWSQDEEWILYLSHRLKGNKWSEITRFLPGRTDNAIKNHWNSSMKKRVPELYQKYLFYRTHNYMEIEASLGIYRNFEEEIIQLLVNGNDNGEEFYFVQSSRRKRKNKIGNFGDLFEKIPKKINFQKILKNCFRKRERK
ncbi:myb-like DNA-binding domain protein [Ichthyophthirius multifiliis]|uniref:Myb-like DNA-binding domain protein n=1 Tax=Ichthyophthirius multifiliis TaxID=5932 RepID=G0R5J8_ICHMU|nr:myb-like DNA-binding domain protein [Ichthyophthirius multifiliis]EGR27258.1 myb-like DNA-binding domain protein [Ichthyophthirius multifiliis]|eukprot:XP_004024142.1 myb-like DNA-binding domain protein [Ichthyophthirius multifiliis]